MNFWKTFQIVGLIALLFVLGALALVSGDQPKQQPTTTSSTPSSDGAAFNGLK